MYFLSSPPLAIKVVMKTSKTIKFYLGNFDNVLYILAPYLILNTLATIPKVILTEAGWNLESSSKANKLS